jgi:hypothetical protein
MPYADSVGRTPAGLSRREVLRRAGLAGVAATLPAGTAARAAARTRGRTRLVALTPAQARTIEAALERLIPSDRHGPGAREARVVRYIDRGLVGDLAEYRGLYSHAVEALDASARDRHGVGFAGLSARRQDAILAAMETNAAPGFVPDSATVFNTIRQHAIEGMFGDPRHGGNAGYVGWDHMGYPGVRLRVRPRQAHLDARVRPAHRSVADIPLFAGRR